MNKLLYVILLFLTGVLLYSCGAKDDINFPVIQILSPSPDAKFEIGDSIITNVRVTDDRKVVSVSFTVVTLEKVPVLSSIVIMPGLSSCDLTEILPINNEQIKGGNYYLLIRASDGKNEKSKYQPISIKAPARELIGYLAVEKKSDYISRIEKLSLQSDVDTAFDYPKKLLYSGINSSTGNFYFVSDYPSSLDVFKLKDMKIDWQVPAPGPLNRFSCFFIGDTAFTGSETSNIAGYNLIGQIVFQSPSIQNVSPEILTASNYIFAGFVSDNGINHYLLTYYRPTSQIKSKINIFEKITGMICENGKLLFFGKLNGGTSISELNPEKDEITHLLDIPYKGLRKVCKIDENRSIIATDQGLFIFDRYYTHISSFSAHLANDLLYDPIGKELYVIEDQDVYILSYPNATELGTISFEYNLSGFNLIYNK